MDHSTTQTTIATTAARRAGAMPTRRRRPGRWATLFATLVVTLAVHGCSNTTEPTGPPTSGLEPGEMIQVEGSLNWFTNSVSWINENEFGFVPLDRYGMISISQRAAQNGPSHFLYRASVNAICNDAACRPGGDDWADPDLTINELDWSPVGARVTFEGRERQGQTNGPAKIFVMRSDGASRTDWGRGLMPSFSRDGGRLAHVTPGKDVIRLINADTGEGGNLVIDYSGIEYPRFSPGDSLLAFSAQYESFGRRIAVADTRRPEFFPDIVSDPDDDTQQSRDGINDNYPTWSPTARHLAYVATVTRGGTFRDAIFLTTPGDEPEMVTTLHFEPGQRIRYLRWHPSGRYMLFVRDGNVYLMVMPEEYWNEAG